MALERCSGKYFILALSGLALSACSPHASSAPQVVAPVANSAAQLATAAAQVTTAPLVTGLPDFTALVDAYGPAVVNVRATERRAERGGQEDMMRERLRQFGIPMPDMPQGGQAPERNGTGSGFIVTKDGYILTNRHVVVDATKVVVMLTDRREYEAKVVGMDETTDVAVLKIDGSNLPTVKIGNPEKLKPGQWVVAIGSPFGMENSVTAGIVSATARSIRGERFVPFIQTDVAVNPGNSGGPLFNLEGEVVGINSQIYSQNGGYMGLSFAIPIDMADNVRQQLVSTGKVTRGRIGVSIQPMDAEAAATFGLERPLGALVADVTEGNAADKAGIKPGDVILAVGGRPVSSEVLLPSMVAAIQPGTRTEFEVWRDGKSRKLNVVVDEAPTSDARPAVTPGNRGNSRGEGPSAERAVLGLSVRPLTPQEKQQVDTDGSLVVESVAGAATSSGIQRGDIILGVGATAVSSVADLRAAVGKHEGARVPLRVQRGDGVRFALVPRQ